MENNHKICMEIASYINNKIKHNRATRPSLDQVMLNWANEHKSVIKESFKDELLEKINNIEEKD